MTTYYVSAGSGDDGNAGTSATAPLASLQAAANLTRPGDTVEVMNGTYTGPNWGDVLQITTSGTSSAPITFEAAPGQTPVIDSSDAWNGIDIQASNIVVKGFTVEGDAAKYSLAQAQAQETNPENPTFDGNGITVQPPSSGGVPNHIVIENNTVFNEPGGGIGTNGADYVQILNNVVHNNDNWSPYDGSGISIYQSKNSDTNPGVHSVISGNVSYDNADRVPDVFTGGITDGEGIILDTNTNYVGTIQVENNTTYGNGAAGIEDFQTNNAVITGNTSYGNNTANIQPPADAEIFINQSTGSTVAGNSTSAPSDSSTGSASGSSSSGSSSTGSGSGSTVSPPATTGSGSGNTGSGSGSSGSGSGGGGSGHTVTLSPSNTQPVINQSNATITGAGSYNLFIGGTNDVVSLVSGTQRIQASAGDNSITTGNGNDTIKIGGSGNVVTAGGGSNAIYDSGSGNTFVIPALGVGRDNIYGNVLHNQDSLDLRALLAKTSWNGSAATLGNYLKVAGTSTGALLEARNSPSGSYSISVDLENAKGATLSQVLAHAIT